MDRGHPAFKLSNFIWPHLSSLFLVPAVTVPETQGASFIPLIPELHPNLVDGSMEILSPNAFTTGGEQH